MAGDRGPRRGCHRPGPQGSRTARAFDLCEYPATHPKVTAHRLPKPALLALSHAIEDESCAGALRPLLIGAFQRHPFYEASRARWSELARTAEAGGSASPTSVGGRRPAPPGPGQPGA